MPKNMPSKQRAKKHRKTQSLQTSSSLKLIESETEGGNVDFNTPEISPVHPKDDSEPNDVHDLL
jgi:hypothetical protein